jgi:ribosomal protein L10
VKIYNKFHKKSNGEKWVQKGGVLDRVGLTSVDIDALAELPSMEVLRGQFMSLLSVLRGNVCAFSMPCHMER